MSNPVPSQIALTSIADGSAQQAAPIRNNFSAIQTFCNAIQTLLSGGSAGQVLEATDASDVQWETLSTPGKQLDYAQITAIVNLTATTEATANAVITGNSVAYDGSQVRVEVSFPVVGGTVAGDVAWIVLLRDATVVGSWVLGTPSGTPQATLVALDTPAAGAHTYRVAGYRHSGTGTPEVGGGAGGSGNPLPAYLRVTKA